ncbi:MAG: oligosaccharide flippase family protein [Lentimicrobiaceae bacterium]|nr:oligosaccharide flippase family protein [Lentimicrobiaceae bacterium]
MKNPVIWLNEILNRGHERSQNIKRNILYSFFIKGGSIIISFLLVPLTLHYLGATDYGIWLTLSSVVAWFGFFDIGLGNGLRNKFAEALALNNKELARSYVSTTYFGLTIIFGTIWVIFIAASFFVNWNTIFNVPLENAQNLQTLIVYVFTLFIVRFVLKLLAVIITADQRPAISNTFDPISNVLSLIVIYILTLTTQGSLMYLALAVTATPVLVLVVASVIFFGRDYKDYRPALSYVKMSQFKELTGIGIQFFIIQIAVLIIFATDNMIITQALGPEHVPAYNIAYKYFNSITMVFAIIMNPLWSAYTQAYVKNDIPWIRNITTKLTKFWLLILAGVILMILISGPFYHIWVGDEIEIPILLTIFMGLFILISTWNNVYVYFINGTGKIRLQLYSSIIAAAVNIPVSIYFAKNLGLGTAGVILATCVCLFPGSILAPIQYFKIIHKNDKGIWGK